ncbi:hypothetical protein [Brasilonema bromeliae]|nr:hypothetical protein [Brasilonema bromeliae]
MQIAKNITALGRPILVVCFKEIPKQLEIVSHQTSHFCQKLD